MSRARSGSINRFASFIAPNVDAAIGMDVLIHARVILAVTRPVMADQDGALPISRHSLGALYCARVTTVSRVHIQEIPDLTRLPGAAHLLEP